MAVEPRIRVSAILRWQDRMLLCRHEKGEKQYWLLPGGGVNSGESLVDALHRELGEELGIAENLPVEGPVAIVDSIAPIRSFAAKHVVQRSSCTRPYSVSWPAGAQGTPRCTSELCGPHKL